MRIVDYILHHGGVCPEKTAVVAGYTKLTYGQLAASIRQAADVMVGSQSPAVVFRTMPTEEFVITYFAAHLAEKVAVPLEKDISEDAYKEICARVSAFQFPHATADVLFTTGTTGRQKGVMISHEVLVANAENFIYAQGYSPETVFVISGPLNH